MNYFRTKNLKKKTLKQENTISSQITVSVIFPVCWHSWTADPRTRVGWRLTCPSLGIIRVLITSFLNAFGCEEWLMIPSSRMCFINTLRWDWRVVFFEGRLLSECCILILCFCWWCRCCCCCCVFLSVCVVLLVLSLVIFCYILYWRGFS